MSDYISRQAAIEAIDCNITITGRQNAELVAATIGTFADRIKALPAADVVPVVHGKWMKEDRGHVEYCAVCDQCGFDWMWSDMGYFKFCPNCGAKMDGERKE